MKRFMRTRRERDVRLKKKEPTHAHENYTQFRARGRDFVGTWFTHYSNEQW